MRSTICRICKQHDEAWLLSFMAIVGLIGFMNMANTMIMNITTKKQEYGILQAVGMTNKQLNFACSYRD